MSLTSYQIEVCNKALLKIGSKTITSEDTAVEARVCNAMYQITVDELLAAHTWSCAIKQAVLITDEEDVLGRYLYPLPSDFIRIVEVNRRPLIDIEFEVIGQDLATQESNAIMEWQNELYYPATMPVVSDDVYYQCNTSHRAADADLDKPSVSDKWDEVDVSTYIHIKYIASVEPEQFNSMFMSCLIPLLASNLATSLSTSQSKSINLINEYRMKLQDARRIDNSQRKTLQPNNSWNRNRR